jgi:HAE1 family hydrophobic/amphiphilic exporter-1
MVSVLLVFGLVAYPRIGVDLMPEVEFPFVTITAIYPGASPETVESKVIDKIEEAVNTINGIKLLRSTSMENVGIVMVQFELERKADQAIQDVRDKVSGILRELPSDLDPPVIEKLDINAQPILNLAISGPLSVRDLTRIADKQVKQRLQSLNGVGQVTIVGGQDREIHVWIDPARLASHYLSVNDVMQALAIQNIEIPGGRLEIGDDEFVVKTHGQVRDADELGNVIITAAMGAPVRVRDVARVEDGAEERRSYSAVNGASAVALRIMKQSGSNTVEVAEKVKEEVEKLRSKLPAGVTISMPRDNSEFIKNAIDDVRFDLVFGAVLAILIVFIFLRDWRATFISALALPTSVIASFGFMKMLNFTFNQMTMLALSLSIGILIDDAIVVIEAIHRHMERGKTPFQAAIDATKEIGLAVMATTASILAVFVPVATMKGIIGRFFFQFGVTVAFAVAVSLFVAFTLTPMLSARLLKPHAGEHWALSRWIGRMLDGIDAGYHSILSWALRHRWLTLGISVATLVGTLGLGGLLKSEFFPQMDRSQLLVTVEMPAGRGLDATTGYLEAIAARIRGLPGVRETFTTVGGGAQGEVNKGEILVNLVPKAQRTYSQEQAIVYIRNLLGGSKEALVAVETADEHAGGMRAAAIQYNVRGMDLEQIHQAAGRLVERMKQVPGFVDLDDTYRGGKPEVAVQIDRDRAADLGVPVGMVAMALRTFFAGDKATDLTSEGDRIDVRVRLDSQYRAQPADILGLGVRSTTGNLVQMANVLSVETGSGPSKIERQDRQRQVTVLANLDGLALGEAMLKVEAIAGEVVPAELTQDWAGFGQIMRESFGYMIPALILAVILVYLILAAQFESFLHPFTIMLSLPFSFVGAFLALLATGMTVNIATFIGLILLMGLVTKNAILLVDYANQLKEKGVPTNDALLQAGPVRLRPILMTTAAMIFGMMPVAAALSEGSEQRAPMAVAVIGGLITSTLLTLVVVPVAYSLLDGMMARAAGRSSRS